MSEKAKTQVPPYISWKTTLTYIQSLQQAFPSRIDTSGMIRLAGGIRGPMLNALKFLRLIKDDGSPEPALRELVDSSSPDKRELYAKTLKRVLENAYPLLFDQESDLANMTPKQFGEKFEKMGISGDTIRKAENFFLDAAKDAGIKVSPIVIDAKKKGPKSPKQNAPGKKKKDADSGSGQGRDSGSSGGWTPPQGELPMWYSTFKPAFDKLPSQDNPKWTKSERDAWLNAISALLDLYVKVDDKGGK